MAEEPWLTIIGLGEDGLTGLTDASRDALAQAEIVTGAARHLALLTGLRAETRVWPVPFADGIAPLIALRSGYVNPALSARLLATLDQMSGGRLCINLIAGINDDDSAADGILDSKEVRYEKMDEEVTIMKKLWASDEPIGHVGKHYTCNQVIEPKPLQKPHPPFFLGGGSAYAAEISAKHSTVHLFWGDTYERIRDNMKLMRELAKKYGREDKLGFGMRLQIICRENEKDAWEAADGLIRELTLAALLCNDASLRRKGEEARYVLSGGKGAFVAEGDALARARLLVATDLDGDPREARIRQGIAIAEPELREMFASAIGWQDVCEWSRREGRVIARRQERLGALVLAERNWPDAPPDAVARAALDGMRQIGLTLGEPARRFRARVEFLRREGAALPDFTDAALLARAEDWLLPHLAGKRTEADLRALDLTEPLRGALTWEEMQTVDRLAPGKFDTPLGRSVPIDYEGEHPSIALRLQELFGVTAHPAVGPRRHPLRITLLSPAGRPVQVTMDLPGFWATSYADVRKDMRGQYPKHPWPEDPAAALPTLRAKPRGT